MFPVLAGKFVTTEPPGKPSSDFFMTTSCNRQNRYYFYCFMGPHWDSEKWPAQDYTASEGQGLECGDCDLSQVASFTGPSAEVHMVSWDTERPLAAWSQGFRYLGLSFCSAICRATCICKHVPLISLDFIPSAVRGGEATLNPMIQKLPWSFCWAVDFDIFESRGPFALVNKPEFGGNGIYYQNAESRRIG